MVILMTQDLTFFEIVFGALCTFAYLWNAAQFCKKYFKASKKCELMFLFCCSGGWVLLSVTAVRYSVPYLFYAICRHLFFIGCVLLFFRAKLLQADKSYADNLHMDREKRILAASILILIPLSVGQFCGSFLCCLVLFWLHTAMQISEPFLSAGQGCIIDIVNTAAVILVLWRTEKYLSPVFYGKTRKWYALLAAPLLCIIAVMEVAGWGASNGIMVRSGGNMSVYYDQIFSHIQFCVLALLCMLAAGFYVFGMERISLEQKKSNQYALQIAAYKALERQYKESERLRHDLKNHMNVLLEFSEKREWKKLEDYLKTMLNRADLGRGEEASGNRVIDVLLSQNRKRAEENDILWKCDVQVSKLCSVDAFDLCVLFGNILDNAVEACERLQGGEAHGTVQPFIDVQASVVKKCFLLEVKNSFDAFDDSRLKCTRKKNLQRHGIGLLNIRDVVQRYNGVMDTELRDNVFVISVLIPLSVPAHDIKQVI